jgi:hypothetical protein
LKLAGGEKILFDFADMRCADDPDDRRIPLSEELKKNLQAAKRDFFHVVAFTHLDNDHICKLLLRFLSRGCASGGRN